MATFVLCEYCCNAAILLVLNLHRIENVSRYEAITIQLWNLKLILTIFNVLIGFKCLFSTKAAQMFQKSKKHRTRN